MTNIGANNSNKIPYNEKLDAIIAEQDEALRTYLKHFRETLRKTRREMEPYHLIYYGNWGLLRKEVLKHSEGICERCRQVPAAHVHHKLPVRFFEYAVDAHFIENLMAVCSECHKLEHAEIRINLPLLDATLSWRTVKSRIVHRPKFSKIK